MHRPARHRHDADRKKEQIAEACASEVLGVAIIAEEQCVAARILFRRRRIRRVDEWQGEENARQRRMMNVRHPRMLREDVVAGREVDVFVARLAENAIGRFDARQRKQRHDGDSNPRAARCHRPADGTWWNRSPRTR